MAKFKDAQYPTEERKRSISRNFLEVFPILKAIVKDIGQEILTLF